MKTRRKFGAILIALGTMVSCAASAEPSRRAPVVGADVLPPYEIVTTLRNMGLNPLGQPRRRGHHYVLHALDPSGVEVRVVADAQYGDILAITPAKTRANAYAPRYDGGPRIIHVPQNGGRGEESEVIYNRRYDRGAALPPDDDGFYEPAPVRKRSYKPRIERETAPPPPPPGPRRAILSAPPPSAEGPTPIRPTPRWNQTDKFIAPQSNASAPLSSSGSVPDINSTPALKPEPPAAVTPPPPPPEPNKLIQFPPVAPLN